MIDERVARGMARQRELRHGRRLGWKLGFGAPAALERFDLDGPLIGFLEEELALEEGAAVSLDGWANPVLEAEVAAHIAPDGRSPAGLAVAVELADLHPPPEDVEEILAGNIFHRHVLLGPIRPDIRSATGVEARVLKNGEEVASTGEPEALTGELAANLQHVTAVLSACGEALRPGDVVIAGAVVPPMPVAAGDEVVVELPPLGALRLSFS